MGRNRLSAAWEQAPVRWPGRRIRQMKGSEKPRSAVKPFRPLISMFFDTFVLDGLRER